MMDGNTYLFIDGAYARQRYRRAMEAVFRVSAEPDPQRLTSLGPGPYFRVYFYDCLIGHQLGNETQAGRDLRVSEMRSYFEEFRSLSGVHVRLGTIAGAAKRPRQKEVDIKLAVDMLTHAFNRNMTHAVLFAGDRDFRPVVEALVRAGVFVEILYEEKTVSRRLKRAADAAIALNWSALYGLGTEEFRRNNPVPKKTLNQPFHLGPFESLIKTGTVRDSPVHFVKRQSEFVLNIDQYDGHSLQLTHPDSAVIERYFSANFAPIAWES